MHDLIIIGGSAAGTAAAIYAARRKLDFILVSEDFGGEVASAGEIHNYPGIPETDGVELTQKFSDHLKKNQVEPQLGYRVTSITKHTDGHFVIAAKKGEDQEEFKATAVIIATGVHPRKLEIPGEEQFTGKGVTYCTTCDGPLFKGKKVATIGGGNSALESALMLSEIADHVTVVNIHDAFKGEQVLIEKVEQKENIDVLYNAQTQEIQGEQFVEKIIYQDTKKESQEELEVQGVFVHIGLVPNSDIAPEEVEKNPWKEIVVNNKAETNVPGLYAAGDVANTPYKQIAIATGQGVTAALSAIEYINATEKK